MGNEIPSKIRDGFFADNDAAAKETLFAQSIRGGFLANSALLLAVRMRTRECPLLIVLQDEAHLLAPMKVLLLPRRSLKSDI